MKNTGEINLKVFWNILLSSKKIFFSVTLVTTLIVAIFTFNNPTQTFISSASVKIGQYNNTSTTKNNILQDELRFLFNVDSELAGYNYLTILSNSPSKEVSIERIRESINHIDSNYKLNKHSAYNADKINLALINNKINIIQNHLKKYNQMNTDDDSLQNQINHSLFSEVEGNIQKLKNQTNKSSKSYDELKNLIELKESLMLSLNSNAIHTNLNLQLEDLINEEKIIRAKQDSSQETQISEIKSFPISNDNRIKTSMLGFLGGIFLSIFLIYFLSIYHSENENSI